MYNLTPEEVLLALWEGTEKQKDTRIFSEGRSPSLVDCKLLLKEGSFIGGFFGKKIMCDILKGDFHLYNLDNGPGAAESALIEFVSGKESFLN